MKIIAAGIATALSVVLVAGGAIADGSRGAAPKRFEPEASRWTGFYAGFTMGHAWGHADFGLTSDPTNPANVQAELATTGRGSLNPKGFTGGISGGYNLQSGLVVVGVEADLQYLDLSSSRAVQTNVSPCCQPYLWSEKSEQEWLATFRLRAGLAFENVLLYATGGWALTDLKTAHTLTFTTLGPGFTSTGSSTTHSGWVIGGGVEIAVAKNWSAKIEYLHLDFGSQTTVMNQFVNGLPVGSSTTNFTADIVRAGINFAF